MLQTTATTATRECKPAEVLGGFTDAQLLLARRSFPAFRQIIRPDMVWGWWVELIAIELQKFFNQLRTGKRPKIAVMAPPQHGKSWTATDFIAWASGRNPNLKTIFASYSEALGERTNRDVQRIMRSPNYQLIFPNTRIDAQGWVCNTELIEFIDKKGSFRNTTVEGQINGFELHLGVIDDPVKGRAEVQYKTARDKTWNWFTDDLLSRMSKDSAILIMMTRWHVDDLLGRFLETEHGCKVLQYPAIAEADEPPHRTRGEPLFPELKPLDFLEERRRQLTDAGWQSIYQQHPIIVGGGIFPVDKLKVVPVWDGRGITRSVRFWDKAATEDGGAHTAGVLMHRMKDDRFVIEHMVRGQWGALEREKQIKMWSQRDAEALEQYEIGVEQEPGSGGKESAEATIRSLAGLRAYAERPTGPKEVRAEPFAAQVQGGNVWLVAGPWHKDFFEELESFPNGRYVDQVDACSGAFNRLTNTPGSTIDWGWMD